jgi:hypothetical protein
MRKLVISLLTINAAASAALWCSRDVKSAVRVAWELPGASMGGPVAAEEPKAIPEENAGRDRRVEMMLSGALLFLIGGRAAMLTGWSFLYRDLRVPDVEEDEPLDVILEPDFVLPDPLPDPEPSPDADFVDRRSAMIRRETARHKIYTEWLREETAAITGIYDPAPIPYCKRSRYYEGPGFEVPLSELDSDSDSDAD